MEWPSDFCFMKNTKVRTQYYQTINTVLYFAISSYWDDHEVAINLPSDQNLFGLVHVGFKWGKSQYEDVNLALLNGTLRTTFN
jgi:hypothetical protein